jgi:hypothetical protein
MLDPVRAKARMIAVTAASFVGGVLLATGWSGRRDRRRRPCCRHARAPGCSAARRAERVVHFDRRVGHAGSGEHTHRKRARARAPTRFRTGYRSSSAVSSSFRPRCPFRPAAPASSSAKTATSSRTTMSSRMPVITVVTMDRQEFRAEVVGRDPMTDIAVIKIDGRRLPAVRFGDPGNARRRVGAGDRQPARPRLHGHGGDREREEPASGHSGPE